jgi:hypothetical protein
VKRVKERRYIEYFRVGNSTWSHVGGDPKDLKKNRISLPKRFMYLWLTDLNHLNSYLKSLGWDLSLRRTCGCTFKCQSESSDRSSDLK